MAPPKMKECNMYGTNEAFDSDGICKSCKKIKELKREIYDLKDMFGTKSLPKRLEREIEKLKVNSKKKGNHQKNFRFECIECRKKNQISRERGIHERIQRKLRNMEHGGW